MIGNVIVGQSGGPTAVMNSSLVGVYKTAFDLGHGSEIYGMMNGISGLLKESIVDLSEHIRDDLDIELFKRTPSAYLGSCRYKLPEIGENDVIYNHVFETLYKYGIRNFFYIGGNDSMDPVYKLSQYAEKIGAPISFIGIPKTTDNDLMVTDHAPGYGSAAKYIGTITKELIRDGYVYDSGMVTVLEVRGRGSGWLAGAAALAKGEDCDGPDLIYLPELPMDIEDFLDRVGQLRKEKKAVLVVVADGVKLADGRYVCELAKPTLFYDAFGNPSLSGTAQYLVDRIIERYGCEARAVGFNSMQRCASHIVSRVDMTEAFQVGGAAVRAAFDGETGKMVTLERLLQDPYQCATGLCSLRDVAGQSRPIPQEWIDPYNMNVDPEFLRYVRPLIQADLPPIMVDGLPRHAFFREKKQQDWNPMMM